MMNMERANNVATIVAEKTGLNANAVEVRKGDFLQIAINIRKESSSISPNIYIDNYDDMEDEEIAEIVVNRYDDIKDNIPNYDLNSILDYNKAKNNLRLCIRRKTSNEDDVKMPFLDMELFVRVEFENTGEEMASVTIKKTILDKWDISAEQLFADAMENMTDKWGGDNLGNIILSGFSDLKTIDEFINNINAGSEMAMYTIGTRDKYWGASIITNTEILSKIADKLDDDLIILPSSIHEIIIVPKELANDGMTAMVQAINADCVSETDQLSDHIYEFNRSTNEVRVA